MLLSLQAPSLSLQVATHTDDHSHSVDMEDLHKEFLHSVDPESEVDTLAEVMEVSQEVTHQVASLREVVILQEVVTLQEVAILQEVVTPQEVVTLQAVVTPREVPVSVDQDTNKLE